MTVGMKIMTIKFLTVNVTQEDIRNGTRANCNCCPIALAIYKISGVSNCQVESKYIQVTFDKEDGLAKAVKYSLPKEVATFIRRVDNILHVDPFIFKLTERYPE